MNLDEINELDLSEIGEFPAVAKFIIILLLCVGVGVGVYYYDIQDQFIKFDRVQAEEAALKQEFEDKQAKAVNLESYKRQLAEMEDTFGAMLRQLPDRTEVPDLLVDVSQTGLAAGLEFELFKPLSEVPREFYAELPISIVVHGSYHEFGDFISGLAALPRIVTIHNITISTVTTNTNKGSDKLILKATAKTYRYLDEEDQ